MNVKSLVTRLPSANAFGADPVAAALRSGAPLDRPDGEARTEEGQAKMDASVEEDFAAKARQVAADRRAADDARQIKDFELNVRRADIVNSVARARAHDGRKLCTPHDASVMWQMEALLHSIAGGKPTKPEPEFDDPDKSRPINSSVDRAIHGTDDFTNGEMLKALEGLSRNVAELRYLQAKSLETTTKEVPVDHDPDV